jgi:hypothetical protein
MTPPTTTRRGPRTKDIDADKHADDNADAEMTTSTTTAEDEDWDGGDDRRGG